MDESRSFEERPDPQDLCHGGAVAAAVGHQEIHRGAHELGTMRSWKPSVRSGKYGLRTRGQSISNLFEKTLADKHEEENRKNIAVEVAVDARIL